MFVLLLLLIVVPLKGNAKSLSKDINFDKTFVGIAYSPYVRDWINHTVPEWSSYTLEEIKVMLEIISDKFQIVSTYSAGYDKAFQNRPWYEANANCLIPRAAAQINLARNNDRHTITVIQGVYQNADPEVQAQEIKNAFLMAEDANSIYNGTVLAINFLNVYGEAEENFEEILQVIKDNKDRAHKLNLRVGTRLHTCHAILGGHLQEITRKIAQESDFLFCSVYPAKDIVNKRMSEVIEISGELYLNYSRALRQENPFLQVIMGEMGWASRGVSHNQAPNSITNLLNFWIGITKWASIHHVPVIMFEAFDEPWKNVLSIEERSNPGGRYGAERHHGWWKRVDDNDISRSAYILKIDDPEEYKNFETENSSGSGYTIGMTVAVFLFFLIIPLIFYLYKQLHKTKEAIGVLSQSDIEEFLNGTPDGNNEASEAALNLPYNTSFEIPKDKMIIEMDKILGAGAFGIVYKGNITGLEKCIAFKTTKPNSPVHSIKSLLAEIKIMSYIGKHENIVDFVGANTEDIHDGIVFVAADFCELGNLEKYLRDRKHHFQFTEQQYENDNIENRIGKLHLIKWSAQIASGMEFLSVKKVIHSDLATRNVLLSTDAVAKITDFGLSRRMYEYSEYVKKNQEPLPWRWMAIESLKKMNFSSQSDVWSFGITLWEIFALGDVPYPGLSWSINFIHDLEGGLRMRSPKYAVPNIYDKMVECWHENPDQRPKFSELSQFLETLYKETSERMNANINHSVGSDLA